MDPLAAEIARMKKRKKPAAVDAVRVCRRRWRAQPSIGESGAFWNRTRAPTVGSGDGSAQPSCFAVLANLQAGGRKKYVRRGDVDKAAAPSSWRQAASAVVAAGDSVRSYVVT